MSKPTWVIENFVKESSFVGLIEAVGALNYPLIVVDKDYKRSMLDKLNTPADGSPQCVIVNGSIKMCRLLREHLNERCQPVTYCSFENYKCSNYYSHFGEYLFNDRYAMMSLRELVRQKFDVWGHYGKDGLLFVRPDSGEKTFQAGLIDIQDIGKLHEANADAEHDLMLVSSPKTIKWEGRFVCNRNREIIASSTYRFQGRVTSIPSVPARSIGLCKEILEKVPYVPDSVFCLDLCQDADNNFWLLELTSFSSAGLYATDKKAVVAGVSKEAEADMELYKRLFLTQHA